MPTVAAIPKQDGTKVVLVPVARFIWGDESGSNSVAVEAYHDLVAVHVREAGAVIVAERAGRSLRCLSGIFRNGIVGPNKRHNKALVPTAGAVGLWVYSDTPSAPAVGTVLAFSESSHATASTITEAIGCPSSLAL